MAVAVKVYVCPTPGCGDYFGASSMPDLATSVQGQRGGNFEPFPRERWFTRASCPSCRERGEKVERVLCEIAIDESDLRSAPVEA